jgi:zinc protease
VTGAHPDATTIEVLASIMTLEPAGRLYKSLVEPRKATNVSNFTASLHDPGFVSFFVTVPLADSIDAARDTAIATLETGVAREPINAAEVERARSRALKNIDEVLADPTRFGVRLSEAIAAGDWRLFFVHRDRMRTITAADVQRVATHVSQASEPHDRSVRAGQPSQTARRRPHRSTSRRWSRTTKGDLQPRPASSSSQRRQTSRRVRNVSPLPTA